MNLKFLIAAAAVLFLSGTRPARADSVTVSYTAIHDVGATWEYHYTLSGSLSAGADLAIYFPIATSSSLLDLVSAGSNFTTFVFQPDAAIPADGEYDVIANVNNPSLAAVFDVTFGYSGNASPGSQSFTLYDSNYNVLESGTTQAASVSPVPEPSPAVLVGSAMIVLWNGCRRRSNASQS